MSTSNSINYATSSSDIITEALELLGVLGEGESYTQDQYISALRTLNMMTKTWQADGLNLFAVQVCYLFFVLGQQEYDLSNTSLDHFTTLFGQRQVSVAATAGDVTVSISGASDIGLNNKIGIQTGGNTMFWTTATNVVGDVVTLLGALPSDVAVGAVVYYYPTTANRPMRVLEAYIHRSNDTDIPVGMISRVDYYSLSRKDSEGAVIQMYFDPQRTRANLFVWPTTSTELDYVRLICQRTLDDFDSATDEPDYPQEWYMPLSYNLAYYLAPKYGTPQMDYQRLMIEAKQLYEMARGFDTEQETSMYLKPDNWNSGIGRRGA